MQRAQIEVRQVKTDDFLKRKWQPSFACLLFLQYLNETNTVPENPTAVTLYFYGVTENGGIAGLAMLHDFGWNRCIFAMVFCNDFSESNKKGCQQ